jgi:hypothetical protein
MNENIEFYKKIDLIYKKLDENDDDYLITIIKGSLLAVENHGEEISKYEGNNH